jgi:uncharacterized membrane protein YbhN (UPF0104 family)
MSSRRRNRFSPRWIGVAFTVALLALVGWLTARLLHDLDWAQVSATLAGYSTSTLAMALLAASIGYIAVSQYDLIGRHYTGHTLPVRRVIAISFIGYTFSLNLGGMIGGMGFRFRLYSNAGFPAATAARVIGLSILGNWIGYILLAGLLFSFAPPQLPDDWHVGPGTLRQFGILLLLASGVYAGLCWRNGGRAWTFRKYQFAVPSLGLSAAQSALSLVSWCANATVIFILLPAQVSWLMALAALLTSVAASLLAHIPGGVGVIELVFIFLLGHWVPENATVAALLGYRCAYYLLPLALAVVLYVTTEIQHARTLPAAEEKTGEKSFS